MAVELKVVRTAAEEALNQRFPALKAALPGNANVIRMREAAFERVARRGLPNRRVEEWKYTDLRAVLREAAPFAPVPDAETKAAALLQGTTFGALDVVRLTVVNGHLVEEDSQLGSLPAGVEIVPLARALSAEHGLLEHLTPIEAARDNPVYQLNTAFMADGAVIRISAAVEKPIHLRFVNVGPQAFATATRVLLLVEEGASATVLETHEGALNDRLAYQPNDVVEVVVGARARLHHVRLNAEGSDAVALSTLAARLGADSFLNTINMVAGSAVSRHQVYLAFAGERAKAQVNGVAMLKGEQHADTTLVVEHVAPHGESRELYKTVVDDQATGVFQGKIIVQPQAQKTDGRMMSAAVLLSEGGTMNNKPELEIFADDVQCAHGATCGALDEELLFYLMARGLPRGEAQSLLLQAFLGEPIEMIEHEGAREALVQVVVGWLRARH